ncbi:unnamed protein product [Anisakis simplex]|uniref:Flavin-containing monooxygenase n=1 Tax=Anisakis simplex TaxID=6269 RepID=A0A0M3JDP0_ANISI|nr:unnamed protein product [Anisakis simplex]
MIIGNTKSFSAHATVNDELAGRIQSGTLKIKPNISSFGETNVTFEDGSSVENVDEVGSFLICLVNTPSFQHSILIVSI